LKLILAPTGAAFFASAGEFIDGGPSAGFGSFRADTSFLLTGFDVPSLPLLFIGVA
jgi:hypothetical protein